LIYGRNLELDHHFGKYFVAQSLLFKVENIITFNKKEKKKLLLQVSSWFLIL
jgi:hypothetical protein